MEIKRSKITKIILTEKHKCGELTLPYFQVEYEATVIQDSVVFVYQIFRIKEQTHKFDFLKSRWGNTMLKG